MRKLIGYLKSLTMTTSGCLLMACGLVLLVGCGESPGPVEVQPDQPLQPSTTDVADPRPVTEVYRLPIEQINELLAEVAADLEVVEIVTGIDRIGSRHRLTRLQQILGEAKAMAEADLFNQNAVTKYRILRDRYRSGGFSPLPADMPMTDEQLRAFNQEMDKLAKGFGEHDSDHLPWLEKPPAE